MHLFENRLAAASELATHLNYLKGDRPVVLGLAPGGVPIADVIARRLDAQMDLLLIERLTSPGGREIVGVVDEHGRISVIASTARWHHVSSQQLIGPAREAFRQLQRQRGLVRRILPELDVVGRTVIIVDEGVDTGARMLGAVASVRDRGARRIIVAAPAGASNATWQLNETADEVVIPHRPTRFKGIEHFYTDHSPVSDELMVTILEHWISDHQTEPAGVQTLVAKFTNSQGHALCCELDLPPGAQRGSGPYPAVIFAHGIESDARSPRTLPISQRLAKRGIVGVRVDLTGHGHSEGASEAATDEQMLDDMEVVARAVAGLHEVHPEWIGVVGAGTGGMIALQFAARHPEITSLVIRGPVCGPELSAARHVSAPTLIIHAERDTALRDSVDTIDRTLGATHQLLCIPDSNRLFSDPISREMMIAATVEWMTDHIRVSTRGASSVEADEHAVVRQD
ncbi:MAG: alpha/beta fold hydrolase [Planctomycetota bacterium]|jgi:predicted phosphoribosyltransferase/dienelactone hydrolase